MSITENNLSAEQLRERYKLERDKRVETTDQISILNLRDVSLTS